MFEPYWNNPAPGPGTVPAGWTSWDVDAGQFWSSTSQSCTGGPITAGAGGAPFFSLSDIETLCPGTVVVGFGVKIGSYNPSYDVEVDLVSFNNQAYDFEPETACTTVCYVDEVNGDDSFGGDTPASAKKTIQAGVDAVAAGGEVRVLPGTYNESPDITKSLTLVSTAGRDNTTINLQPPPGLTYLGSLTVGGDDVTVDGFTIVGRDGTPSTVAASNIFVNTGLHDIIIENNRLRVGTTDPVSTTGDDGIGVITSYTETPADFVASVSVHDNIFQPLNSAGRRAFFINPGVSQFTFEDNTITGNFERIAWTSASDGLVADNVLTGSGSSGGMGALGYPDADNYGKTTFRGNTISAVATGISVDEANNVNVTRNVISASAKGVDVLNEDALGTFDPASVVVNRNSLAVGSGNTGLSADPAFSSSVDGTCNWWGNFTGPGAIASGTGSKVTSNVTYSPWLQSSNLDGDCEAGNITIIVQAHPEGSQPFSFTGTNGIAPFTLVDDGTPSNIKSFAVPTGLYVFRVGALPKWALFTLKCDTHETILKSHRLVQIQLHAGENVTCTFTESYRVPDASIALTSGGPYSGENVYSGAVSPSQTLNQSIAPGTTKSFWVHLQNDGLDKDTFRVVSLLKGSLNYHVVFMAGTNEITGKVNAGTYRVTLKPGATKMIEIRVTADPATLPADARSIILSMQSITAPASIDTVKAGVATGP